MKTKQYNESLVQGNNSCHSSMIYQLDDKKFKFTYTNGNCYEKFKIEMFDGFKLNPIATMADLRTKVNGSAYINTEVENINRVAELNESARKYVESLITY